MQLTTPERTSHPGAGADGGALAVSPSRLASRDPGLQRTLRTEEAGQWGRVYTPRLHLHDILEHADSSTMTEIQRMTARGKGGLQEHGRPSSGWDGPLTSQGVTIIHQETKRRIQLWGCVSARRETPLSGLAMSLPHPAPGHGECSGSAPNTTETESP